MLWLVIWMVQHCSNSEPPHQKRWTVEVDFPPTNCLQQTQMHIFFHTCSSNSWCLLLILHYDWCLPPRRQSNTPTNWCQWGSSPLCILFPNILLHTVKLWHLWSGTPGCHPHLRRVVSIPSRDPTDHKNLSYIRDSCKLSRWQARWSLFLQDFNIIWQVTPRTQMVPADALSRWDMVDTSLDNTDTTICSESMIIRALDLALTQHVQALSASDPLVLCAIENLCTDTPLFSHSFIKNWTYEGGHLYYKGRMYISLTTHHILVSFLHWVTFCRQK